MVETGYPFISVRIKLRCESGKGITCLIMTVFSRCSHHFFEIILQGGSLTSGPLRVTAGQKGVWSIFRIPIRRWGGGVHLTGKYRDHTST